MGNPEANPFSSVFEIRLNPVSCVKVGTVPYADHCVLNHVSATKIFDTVTQCTHSAYDKLTQANKKEYKDKLDKLESRLRTNCCLPCAHQKGKRKDGKKGKKG